MNKIDMSWGSPAFLIPYWESLRLKSTRSIDKDLSYDFGSKLFLKNTICAIHQQEKNAVVNGRHIVIGAGATQLILGLLHVLKKETGAGCAWANPPHFSRFPKLADYAGLNWEKKQNSILITTIPNNPDGASVLHKKTDILDLTYNWSQYVKKVKQFDFPIMVFSLSKATGHASTRIGWAIIKDEMIAKALEQQIEYSTSGLSVDAQIAADVILNSQLNANHTVFEDGRRTLQDRHDLINQIQHKLPFKILNMSGMFLWAEGECPKKIIGLDGRSLCGPEGTFRLNIGCSSENFIAFYNLFSNEKLTDTII